MKLRTEDIEVFVRTRNNLVGLNTLLWALIGQILRPVNVTLFNTGQGFKQEEVWYALSFFDEVKIINKPNSNYVDKQGEFNFSLQLIDCINHFSKKYIWFFDDDLYVPSNCLKELVKQVPSMPKFVVNYTPLKYENTSFGFYGLLASIEDWKKSQRELIKKDFAKIGEDMIIYKTIKPKIVDKTFVIHTRYSKLRTELLYYELGKRI
ncbi:MAG: glycosyltransferase [Candidatus Heimdallarchaeaceae archaeon]